MSQILALVIQNAAPVGVPIGVSAYCAVKRVNPLALGQAAKHAAFLTAFIGMMAGGIIGSGVNTSPKKPAPVPGRGMAANPPFQLGR